MEEEAEKWWIEAVNWLKEKKKKTTIKTIRNHRGQVIHLELELESNDEITVDLTVELERRCTVCIKRGVLCRWSTVSPYSDFLEFRVDQNCRLEK